MLTSEERREKGDMIIYLIFLSESDDIDLDQFFKTDRNSLTGRHNRKLNKRKIQKRFDLFDGKIHFPHA